MKLKKKKKKLIEIKNYHSFGSKLGGNDIIKTFILFQKLPCIFQKDYVSNL